MSRLPIPGKDADIWGDILNDFLAVSHMEDGTIRASALPEPQVSNGSITPEKLSQPYVPASQKGTANGVASLDSTGKLPSSQLPSGVSGSDATTTSKGVILLAGDLAGTADAPTVPGLVNKINTSARGATNGVASLDGTGKVPAAQLPATIEPDATTTTKGILQLAGDLGGTATAPTVPGLANKINTSEKGVANGVASLDGTGKVPSAQLPSSLDPDATTTTKGVVQLAGDLGGTAAAPTVPALATKINSSEKGAANGVATLDATGKLTSGQIPITGRIQAFSSADLLMVDPGMHRLYNDTANAWTIVSVRASVGGAPTGASVIVDVNVNGTTIFTTQANRPAIAAAGFTSGKVTNMDVTSVPVGGYLTVDVDQVGSTSPGSDLTVQVEVV